MSILKTTKLDAIKSFVSSPDALAVVARSVPEGSADFFQRLAAEPVEVVALVRKDYALADIRRILTSEGVAAKVEKEALYEPWLRDMAMLCEAFCDLDKCVAVGFWLGTKRECSRYHLDPVPYRLLVTYAGKGTEILPASAADYDAYETGKPNAAILKDSSARWYVNQWDVAMFRGGEKGVLHRTPDEASNEPSLILRLDQASFWLPEGPGWSDPLKNKKKDAAAHAKAPTKAKKAASSMPAKKKAAATAVQNANAAKVAKAAVTRAQKAAASQATNGSASKSEKNGSNRGRPTEKESAKTHGAKKKTRSK